MNTDNFENLSMCDFSPNDRDIKLYNLAEYYAVTCEKYDLSVCHARNRHDGSGQPVTPSQFSLTSKHAERVMDGILIENPEFSKKEILKVASSIDAVSLINRELSK